MYSKNTPTKLSLARWAELMGINPLHFAGVLLPGPSSGPTCDMAWSQYSWQAADAESRSSVADAIAIAERNIEAWLGYRLLPSWEVQDERLTSRPYKPELVGLGRRNVRGYNVAVEGRWGLFVEGGQRGATLIDAAAAIVWSDPDLDGYNELGTVTVATTVTDEEEIRVYYSGHGGEDGYEIRPITVSIAAGVATITFARHNAVLLALDERYTGWDDVDGTVDANFETTVAVYRIYNDESVQATLVWEPVGGCDCDPLGSCGLCSPTTQTACIGVRDAEASHLTYHPATYASGTWTSAASAVGRNPDRVRLWYRAGLRDQRLTWPTRTMSSQFEMAVAVYAASLLDRAVCGCASKAVERWQQDLNAVSGAEEIQTFNLSERLRNNPLGTRRGAIFAWERINEPNVRIYRSGVTIS